MSNIIFCEDNKNLHENNITSLRKTSQKTSQRTSQKTSQKIIELIANNPQISTIEMATTIGVDRRNIARQIKKLQDTGVIRRVGSKKGGYWEITNT